ncbi:beta-catenin-like protein 1 [Leptotrombidium deliense]|uniref:Beta-catenin-like protein 1 n=1 Tax=Leptotrombidium deliense TaxID=299467 RepID=A0A443SLK8_9ACAR|nr:beta-catenin-like protein 1 [Leptotrombidium deliense]
MDIEELLNYKPVRSIEDLEKEESAGGDRRATKRKLSDLDSDLSSETAPLDEMALKRLLLQFERRVLKNQELRIKFADNPTKFMDSEMELFDIIQKMNVISTQPELYSILVELKIIPTIMGLLCHENTDISCAIVAFLHELCDLDNCEEIEEVNTLMDALIDGQLIAQLVSNLERLDETQKDESEGVYNTLAIIESVTDYKPELTKDCQALLAWILQRLKMKLPFDANKLYSSEILAILLHNNEDNRKQLGSLNGIDTVLQQLAYYKRHDPSTSDEHEYMENLFDCLCSSLLCCYENRDLFFKGEGIELMNLIIKEKRKRNSTTNVRMGAIKVINHVLSTDKGKDDLLESCCNKFVDILGLRVLFPVFMNPKSVIGHCKKRELRDAVENVEEHCLSIILALLKYCKSENKRRVVTKFMESDFEKTERLMELHFKYADKLIKCDSQIKKERAQLMANDEEIDEDELFMRRLNVGGLFILQLTDHIIIRICSLYDEHFGSSSKNSTNSQQTGAVNKSETIKARIMKLINIHVTSVNHYKFIKQIMKDMAEEQEDKEHILELIEEF